MDPRPPGIDLDREGPKAEDRYATTLRQLERADRQVAAVNADVPIKLARLRDAIVRQRKARIDVAAASAYLLQLIEWRRREGTPSARELRSEVFTRALPIIRVRVT